jgi:hypothetical protein
VPRSLWPDSAGLGQGLPPLSGPGVVTRSNLNARVLSALFLARLAANIHRVIHAAGRNAVGPISQKNLNISSGSFAPNSFAVGKIRTLSRKTK